MPKFARWLRATCTILLSRSTPADRTKALGYVDQAVAVLEEHGEVQEGNDVHPDAKDSQQASHSHPLLQVYPTDERQWLLGTADNTGIECLQFVVDLCRRHAVRNLLTFSSASMADEAKRWFELSTVICRFVPDGDARAEKVSHCLMALNSIAVVL